MDYFPVNQSKLHFVSTLSGLVVSIVLFAGLVTCSQLQFAHETKPLNERTEGTILLAGCIVIEPEKYMHQPLQIQFAHEPVGKTKLKSVWGRTDSQGYFILPNMPAGRYAISDVWQEKMPDDIWLASDPGDLDTPWHYISFNHYPPLPGLSIPQQWPEIHEGGIINFRYLIITIDESMPLEVMDSQYDRIKAYERSSLVWDSFLSGRVYNRPPIPAYLLDKYPESDWAPYLQRLVDKPR